MCKGIFTWRPEQDVCGGVPSSLSFLLLALREGLSLNWKFIVWGWPASELLEPAYLCTLHALMEIQAGAAMPGLYVGAGDSNLGPPVCRSSSPPEPSPQPAPSAFLLAVFHYRLSFLLLSGLPPPHAKRVVKSHH